MIGLKRGEHLGGIIDEVDHVCGVLAGMRAIEARQCLHGLDAGQPLVHVHGAQQRLIETGLELVRDQKDLVFVALERLAYVAALQVVIERDAAFREAVWAGLGVGHFARERHQRTNRVAAIGNVSLDGKLPSHGLDTTSHDDHGLGVSRQ